jgi:hypothetical protein
VKRYCNCVGSHSFQIRPYGDHCQVCRLEWQSTAKGSAWTGSCHSSLAGRAMENKNVRIQSNAWSIILSLPILSAEWKWNESAGKHARHHYPSHLFLRKQAAQLKISDLSYLIISWWFKITEIKPKIVAIIDSVACCHAPRFSIRFTNFRDEKGVWQGLE